MAGYIIAEVEVTDPETYATYRARTPGVIERYGGRFIVRGGPAELLEGDRQPSSVRGDRIPGHGRRQALLQLARLPSDHRHPPARGQEPARPGRRPSATDLRTLRNPAGVPPE